MQSGPQTGLKRQVWKGRQYPNVFQHFMFLGCLWVLMSGLKVLAGPAIFWCLGAMLFIPPKSHPDHWPLVGIQIPSLSTTSQVQNKHSRGPTAHFGWNHCLLRGFLLPPRDCGNAITYVAQSQGTDFVDHPRWITIDFYCDPVGVRGEFQPTGDLSKREATEGKWRAKYCSMFWI